MFRSAIALPLVLVGASFVGADEPKAKPSDLAPKFEALKKNYREALEAIDKLKRAGKTEEAKFALERNNPNDHLTKMLELPFLHPKDPFSFDILFFLLKAAESDVYLWDQVMVLMRRDHSASERMKHVVRLLIKQDDDTADLLRALIANNPDKKVCAQACKLILDYIGSDAKTAEAVEERPGLKPLLERRAGEEYVRKIQSSLEKNKKESKDLTELLADKYKGVLPDLSDGKPLPDVAVEDLAGKKLKLSDFHGKIVVLNLLATTDNQATLITDHQRELAKKHADQPLAIVNVFVDEKKETVTEFLKKNATPWTSCWSGTKDSLLEEWNLPATPATFIVDAKGVIRYRDRYRGTLDDVLPELLKEAEKK